MSKQTAKIYILKGGMSPLTYHLPSSDKPKNRLLYYDEKNNQNRALRYARNQKSPFIDEQDANVVLEAILFTDGQLTVPMTNPELIKFLEIHPLKNQIFEEFDPEAMALENLKNEDLMLDALIRVREMQIEEMQLVLRNFTDLNVSDMTSSEIKYETKIFAKRNPELFLEALDDPGIEIDNISIRAFEDGFVSLRDKGKSIFYNMPDKKTRLMVIPHGVQPTQALSSWLTSDEGLDFYEMLQKHYQSDSDSE
jgi:hypothetical protein